MAREPTRRGTPRVKVSFSGVFILATDLRGIALRETAGAGWAVSVTPEGRNLREISSG